MTGNTDIPYYIAGVLGLTGSLLMAFQALLQSRQNKQLEAATSDPDVTALRSAPVLKLKASESENFVASSVSL